MSGIPCAGSPRSILCIRHGVTEMNEYLARNPYGTRGFVDPGLYDTRLTPGGRQAAAGDLNRKLKEAHKRWPIELAVSSPLSRALHTAELGLDRVHIPRMVSPLIAERRYLSSDIGRAPSLLAADFPTFKDGLVGKCRDECELSDAWWWEGCAQEQARAVEMRMRLQGVSLQNDLQGVALAVEPASSFVSRMCRFRRWLASRPERRIAVVAHWGVFYSLLGGRNLLNCEVIECSEEDLLDEPLAPPE